MTRSVSVLEGQGRELADLDRETGAFIASEVAALNSSAAKLGLPFVITAQRP